MRLAQRAAAADELDDRVGEGVVLAFWQAAETSPLIAPWHSLPRRACVFFTASLAVMSAVWAWSPMRCHFTCAVLGRPGLFFVSMSASTPLEQLPSQRRTS